MSLLTEADIIKIHPWMPLPEGDDPDTDMNTHMATATAQQAKTLKAVAKEMDSRCPHFQKRRPKSDCPGCMVGLMTACLGGKLSGEE